MRKKSITYIFASLIVLFFPVALIIYPEQSSEAAKNALFLCANTVIPSLFPFFVVSKLITNMRFSELLEKWLNKIMFPLFTLSGNTASALILGMIGGYPIGAMSCASAYESEQCSKKEAERLLAFCNNCGPAFMIGAVGNSVFKSTSVGILLFAIHIISALLTGIIFRIISPLRENSRSYKKSIRTAIPQFSFAFTDAVYTALKSSLTITAYITLFSVIVCLIKQTPVLSVISNAVAVIPGIEASMAEAIICGMLEMTVGIYSVAKVCKFEATFVLTAFLIGFGGLSVYCQVKSCISNHKLNTLQYFLGKLTHSIISAILAFFSLSVFSISATTAFASNTMQGINERPSFIPLLFTLIIFIFCKKEWKK